MSSPLRTNLENPYLAPFCHSQALLPMFSQGLQFVFCATTFSLCTSAIKPALRSTCPSHHILLVRRPYLGHGDLIEGSLSIGDDYLSLVLRKPFFCEADQRLCFRYTDSTIPLLPKSGISIPQPSSVAAQPGLCRTWSETPKTGFLITRLI